VETVPRLYGAARREASYSRSLRVLRAASEMDGDILIKSGIMLGLGEKEGEVLAVLDDLRAAGCAALSIGQYLSPGKDHLPVTEYLPPDRFEYYMKRAEGIGFAAVQCGPYVRSSYMAHKYMR
jgi:lipoic acid synthetase